MVMVEPHGIWAAGTKQVDGDPWVRQLTMFSFKRSLPLTACKQETRGWGEGRNTWSWHAIFDRALWEAAANKRLAFLMLFSLECYPSPLGICSVGSHPALRVACPTHGSSGVGGALLQVGGQQ